MKSDINTIYNNELPAFLNDYFNYLSTIKGCSVATIVAYTADLSLLLKFLKMYKGLVPSDKVLHIEEISIKDLTLDTLKTLTLQDLYAFISYLGKYRANGNYAKARKIASIKSLFKYLTTKSKVLNIDPSIDLESPKLGKRSPVFLTLDESKTLLDATTSRDKHSIRDHSMITLFLNCGLRLSELCSINISDMKNDTLSIIGKGNKERTIYLNKASLKAIYKYLPIRNADLEKIHPEDKDALFISGKFGRINKRTVERIVKKHIGNAGLNKNKYTPHKLRHTSATLMYKYGNVDIRSLQEILGHENISTTQIYTHVDNDKLRNAVKSNPLSDE
ncbi:tyrosine recombinase XerC [Clostridium tagluense]|uniref:tyrosine recombinase XerC n=1 Tax=Clostridium tagluense TaxID=360422 RepID=UPI001CF58912|nr:tyrosine recombinase XerC [Clostridium tagluense]MCB2312816.1 tyrosine recombinase XerC [Clostridium tagluense]MCB2317582.1 tyrosine recombinase XerC [Clostridium tagluense]MCB2322328.1 tyrosine recombinase XerC [Clostridium tagluense]MCB2327331.1 tyrosine recombinase XerC [Clostridium tagluense]MCB2332050.1 tyrosine recombinase XerC [Clostridium tagluense]